jgi:hypothetical protein
LGQVFLIQSAAAVDSLWPCPGFGQFAGAVMLRIGMVMIRSGSQLAKLYSIGHQTAISYLGSSTLATAPGLMLKTAERGSTSE